MSSDELFKIPKTPPPRLIFARLEFVGFSFLNQLPPLQMKYLPCPCPLCHTAEQARQRRMFFVLLPVAIFSVCFSAVKVINFFR